MNRTRSDIKAVVYTLACMLVISSCHRRVKPAKDDPAAAAAAAAAKAAKDQKPATDPTTPVSTAPTEGETSHEASKETLAPVDGENRPDPNEVKIVDGVASVAQMAKLIRNMEQTMLFYSKNLGVKFVDDKGRALPVSATSPDNAQIDSKAFTAYIIQAAQAAAAKAKEAGKEPPTDEAIVGYAVKILLALQNDVAAYRKILGSVTKVEGDTEGVLADQVKKMDAALSKYEDLLKKSAVPEETMRILMEGQKALHAEAGQSGAGDKTRGQGTEGGSESAGSGSAQGDKDGKEASLAEVRTSLEGLKTRKAALLAVISNAAYTGTIGQQSKNSKVHSRNTQVGARYTMVVTYLAAAQTAIDKNQPALAKEYLNSASVKLGEAEKLAAQLVSDLKIDLKSGKPAKRTRKKRQAAAAPAAGAAPGTPAAGAPAAGAAPGTPAAGAPAAGAAPGTPAAGAPAAGAAPGTPATPPNQPTGSQNP